MLGAGDVATAPVMALCSNWPEPACLLNLGQLLTQGSCVLKDSWPF
jgi:hypothetical protein